MSTYNVQIITDEDKEFVLSVEASSEAEAEMTAIELAESGETENGDCNVVECYCLDEWNGIELIFDDKQYIKLLTTIFKLTLNI